MIQIGFLFVFRFFGFHGCSEIDGNPSEMVLNQSHLELRKFLKKQPKYRLCRDAKKFFNGSLNLTRRCLNKAC